MTPDQTQKTQNEKNGQQGEKADTSTLQLVTVRLPVYRLPHPLPGPSFTAFGRKGVGGGVRPSRCNICTGPRSSPFAPKHRNNSNREVGWEMSRLPTPVWEELCIMHLARKKKPNSNPQTRHCPPRQRPDKPEPTSTKTASDDDERKKKAGAGLDLGERAEHGVRIEDVERVREEENTRGNPNP